MRRGSKEDPRVELLFNAVATLTARVDQLAGELERAHRRFDDLAMHMVRLVSPPPMVPLPTQPSDLDEYAEQARFHFDRGDIGLEELQQALAEAGLNGTVSLEPDPPRI